MLSGMARKKRRHGGGQPHKGDRRLLATRLPRPLADEIEERSDVLDMSLSDYLAMVLTEHLATTDRPDPGQTELVSRSEVSARRSA